MFQVEKIRSVVTLSLFILSSVCTASASLPTTTGSAYSDDDLHNQAAYCIGDYSTVTAAGFPDGTVFAWQHFNSATHQWEDLVINGETQVGDQFDRISIPVAVEGPDTFRVFNANPALADSAVAVTDTLLFYVIGKECLPADTDSLANDVTGLEPVPSASDPLVSVYSAEGYLIRKSVPRSKALSGLRNGIYIVEGRKVHVAR